MLSVRCPHCLHGWQAPDGAADLACPVCGKPVVAPAAAVETGFSLPLPSGNTSDGAGCAPASVGGSHPFLSPPQAPDEIGRLGRYRVLRELGAGGMGVVFEAEDTRLERRVALKVMRVEAAAHTEGRARFLREAKAAASLDHEHIVAVFDMGEENGAPFLVLPLLKGESLEDRLRRERPLPLAEALRIAAEMAEGLAAAHEAGLVHRDVKPGNVWLTAPGGRVKLLDFGLARLVEGEGGMTRSGAVMGTPAYMSPEQAAGGKGVDGSADLFSLGAVLYELLTGRRAFRGDSWMEVLANRLRFKPPAPREVNAAVPEEISELVMWLLAEEPAGRPSSARQVARELRALGAPPARSLHLSGQRRRQARPAGARRWWLGVVAVGLLLPLGWALWPRGNSPTGPPPQGPPRGEQPRPGIVAADAAAFATGFHDAAGAELGTRQIERDARQRATLAFADGLHLAASVTLLARHETRVKEEQERLKEAERRLRQQEAVAAALACADGLHTTATATAAQAFGNALHKASAATGAKANTPAINTLKALLGKVEESEEMAAFRRGLKDPPKVSRFSDIYYHEWKDHGLAFLFDKKGALTTIFLYADGADGYKQYRGQLPEGLRFSDTREDVENKLGEPEKLDPAWDVYLKRGVCVVYVQRRPDERGNKIHHITIQPVREK
jgi:hypothetical protein